MSIKSKSLEHWKQNKEWLEQLDWDDWMNTPAASRTAVAPIFGKDCSYCDEFFKGFDDCSICPLHNESPHGCCKEWDAVYYAIVNRPTTKKRALNAVDKMIKHIEEADDVGQ